MKPVLKFCPVPPPLPVDQWQGLETWAMERRAGHTASRLAQIEAWTETRGTPPPSFLSEQNYHHLVQDPELLCSRSHTRDMAIAALMVKGPQYCSLGVDLEQSSRVIKTGIQKFFLVAEEQSLGLSDLEIWCAKEAAFKALSSYMLESQSMPSKALTLKDIRLTSGSTYQYQGYEGHFEFPKTDLNHENYMISFAYLSAP